MKLFFLLGLISSSLMANIYQFDINLKFKKGAFSQERQTSATLNSKLNEEMVIERDDLKTVFKANYSPEWKALDFKGKVFLKKNGKLKLIHQPHFVFLPSENASIEVKDDSGDILEIQVNARKLEDSKKSTN